MGQLRNRGSLIDKINLNIYLYIPLNSTFYEFVYVTFKKEINIINHSVITYTLTKS